MASVLPVESFLRCSRCLKSATSDYRSSARGSASLGPQVITRDGASAVVIVSAEEWERKSIRSGTLADFFAASPLPGAGLVLERSELAPAIEL